MDSHDIRHLLAELHRIANATEHIAAALEQANAADPMQMIERALTGESDVLAEAAKKSVSFDEAEVALNLPRGVPPEEAYRFRGTR